MEILPTTRDLRPRTPPTVCRFPHGRTGTADRLLSVDQLGVRPRSWTAGSRRKRDCSIGLSDLIAAVTQLDAPGDAAAVRESDTGRRATPFSENAAVASQQQPGVSAAGRSEHHPVSVPSFPRSARKAGRSPSSSCSALATCGKRRRPDCRRRMMAG